MKTFTLWTIGKINASPNPVLDGRVQELIDMQKSIQEELDFIYHVVAKRLETK